MQANETSGQEASESVDEQRARWERFSMIVLGGGGGGYVNVRNDSHGDDASGHIYSVRVEDGEATGCSCPHAVHRGAHCKHQVAVEDRPLVVSSATAAAASPTPQVATDGGEPVDDSNDGRESDDLPAIEDAGEHRCRCAGCGREGVQDLDGESVILHTRDCPRSDDQDGEGSEVSGR